MGPLLLQLHDLAVDLVDGQVQGNLGISAALARGQHRRSPSVDVHVDPADARGEAASLALLGEVHLGVRDAPEVAFEACQLPLGILVQLGRESARVVVQYDLHKPSIGPTGAVSSGLRACSPGAAGTG